MHEVAGANDPASKRSADGLVAKADAQCRDRPAHCIKNLKADARFFWRAGPG